VLYGMAYYGAAVGHGTVFSMYLGNRWDSIRVGSFMKRWAVRA
jgi:uncharacterized repeat protein (TIGR03803 family)